MIMLVSGLLTLGLVAALVGVWALWTYQGPGPATKSGGVHVVMLRRGAGLNEIASALEKAGAVRSAPVFLAAAQITGAARELKAGEYEFPNRAPMSVVLDYVREGRVVRHQVTIPEGWTSEMVVEALMKEPALTGEVATPAEGTILPETYEFERGEERGAVLQRMMDDRDRLLASLWDKRKSGLPVRTPEEAVTLASIVEKETGIASERPRVAAVFMNRLNQGIRLQSDPTIIYGLTRGRPLGRGIRRSELDAPNPYNTYQIDGLPPGPIANPGRASLAAVLDPPESTELFFVADGSGGHVFASTLEEHNRNVERWRIVEQQKAAERAAKGN
ncbi:MAG: endolytic transglycosylase MltG [Caulobacter sp.]|nr:endolytic transglycosylase MltG [Caulobacter sp.]